MDVAEILAIARRWWWLVVLGVLFSVGAYGVTARTRGGQTSPTYQAATTLFVTLPPLPESASTADASKQPWELDRLMATYAQMVKSNTVADQAIRQSRLATSPADLAARVSTDTFGYTQLLRVGVTAGTPLDAERSRDAIITAFAAVRAEQSIPGSAAVFETSPAVRTDRAVPLAANLAIVILAGLLASAGVIFAFERLRPSPASLPVTAGAAVITGLAATRERAV